MAEEQDENSEDTSVTAASRVPVGTVKLYCDVPSCFTLGSRIYIYMFLIIYLAVPSLRCGTRDLRSSLWRARSLFFLFSYGM